MRKSDLPKEMQTDDIPDEIPEWKSKTILGDVLMELQFTMRER